MYKFDGVYTVSIIVRDSEGLEAKATATVKVGDQEQAIGFSVSPTSGSVPLNVIATVTLPPRTGFDLVEVCGSIVVGTLDWGDGTTSSPTRLGCSSQRVVSATHTYQNSGNYTVVFRRNDGTRFVETVRITSGVSGVTFSATPTLGNPPLTVTFSAPGGSSCADGNDYEIDYGDGSPRESTGSCTFGLQTRTHTYLSSGAYTATL
ncbi:MAG: hypothetical protein JKX80_02390, partial [Candidatus Pacebacteria bacterium]|nr:hypothetical protein [Candidatus Paceibacterota bacterium]